MATVRCARSLYDLYQFARLRQTGLSLVVTAGPKIGLATMAVAINPYKKVLTNVAMREAYNEVKLLLNKAKLCAAAAQAGAPTQREGAPRG